jgi:hypothetical protein
VWDETVAGLKAGNMLQGDREQLTKRVPTRWNSDHDCLAAHIHFRLAVTHLTKDSTYGLNAYKLTNRQWELAEELAGSLSVCLLFFFLSR